MSMRLPRMALALVAMAVIGAGSVKAVAAQDDADDEFDFSQLEGIELVVGRTYSMDFAAMMASPEAMEEMEYPTGVVTAFAVVAKFDGDDNAEAGWEALRQSFGEEAATVMGVEDAEITELDVEDLADNAAGYTTTVEEDGTTFNASILILREGEYAYASIVTTGGDDATEPATALAEEMIDADAGDGEGEPNDDGVYSGGLWDKLPEEGDDSVEGLIVAADEPIFPEVEDTTEE